MRPNHADLDYLARLTAYSCTHDPRFSYYVYVPENWHLSSAERPARYRLIILVHGSERGAELYRNSFKEFAERTDSVILAPLFPAGLVDPDQLENYNFLRFQDVEFDTVLIHMIDELARRFPVETHGAYLHGFSAGGQFVHRFFYLYPERIRCLSVGAPGNVTHLNQSLPWPMGTGGIENIFGRSPDMDLIRRVRVQVIVGGADTYIHNPASALNRLQLNEALRDNYLANGIEARFTVVPGVGHRGLKVISEVINFFSEDMARETSRDLSM